MSEGLRVNVIPVIDENEWDNVLRTFSQKVSETPINGTIVSTPSGVPITDSGTPPTTVDEAPKVDASGSTVTIDEKTTDAIEEAIVEGETTVEERQDSQKVLLKNIKDRMSKFVDTYTAESDSGGEWKGTMLKGVSDKIPDGLAKVLGVASIGLEVVSNIFDRVMRSSKILQEVWGLFDNAFTWILTPIGNIIAIEMMPMIRDMYKVIGEWMSNAMKIYDKDGWTGLIIYALGVGVQLMWETLAGIGSILLKSLNDWLTTNPMWIGFFTAINIIKDGVTNLIGFFKPVTDTAGDVFGTVWDFLKSNVPFLATGGVVTQPTPAVFGESGTEAVLPLDYLDTLLLNNQMDALELATPYITSTIMDTVSSYNGGVNNSTAYNSRTATNVYNTINVYSNDPNHVGNEIKRMLDKSVGKVLSLY